ncbi:MAG: trypsin-like peptidase domain-containing protein [Clostridia bacterium]|nr:trypsin-like peptidase domain-containing protein [Clostridia bacterium]
MYVYSSRPEKRGWKTFLTIVFTAIITIAVMKYIPMDFEENEKEQNIKEIQKLNQIEEKSLQIEKSSKETMDFVAIVKENMPSVVGVSVLKPDGDGILDFNVTEKWGIGTGIIVSREGYILTNQHLASNVNGMVTITLDNGEEVKGKTIWNEANLDLAIVKITPRNDLKPVTVGSALKSQIGEEVIAIGNPLGIEFQKTVTKGVISGLGRTLKVEDKNSTVIMENLIQTDASINTGNSGGPLINNLGEVIGINTVKITSAEGIGFAVPIDIVKPILKKLERDGAFEEGYLGIFAYDAEIVPYLNKTIETNSGIYVATVNRGGPAYNAGLMVGDIILTVNGTEINKMNELREYIYNKVPGEQIELKVLRKDIKYDFSVTLGRR